jgi:hypothetical protein
MVVGAGLFLSMAADVATSNHPDAVDFDKDVWWSLKPLLKPRPPAGARAWDRNPIDAFIRTKMKEKGLAPSPEADKRTLIRRVYFDLIGLPATPDEIEAFLKDESADAYEKVVDRLLASPRFGERWARHWLDVVHYGDTHGYDKDQPRPNAWPYRDYVIRSFNDDKPYARFIQEQVAGDVLFPDTLDGIVATGFIAAGPWDLIGHTEVPETKIDGKVARHLDRDDMVANTMNTFVSLTVQCAQCHNHKFDPIPQEDYYRLQAVFSALDRADRPYSSDPNMAAKLAKLKERQASAQMSSLETELAAIERERKKIQPAESVYAGTVYTGKGSFTGTGANDGKPRPIFVLRRGDVKSPLQEVGPGALSSIPGLAGEFNLPPDHPEGARRAALAKWLTDSRNPLAWRSIVNRIWQYHFGRGIVGTPNDFGRMGQLPTHPELLDWLAAEFRDGGQSLKKLHRLIVTSATYRQSSNGNKRFETLDSDNAYLWRMNRRKLEAEAIRDAVLAVAGKLDLAMYGPAYRDFVVEHPEHSPHYEYQLHNPDDPKSFRRSIYRFLVRSKRQPFMSALDCADPSIQVDKRNETLSPLQALALYNDGFMLTMAAHLAERVSKEKGTDAQVAAAFQLAVGRAPTADELGSLREYTAKNGLANACRVILNLNEFVFID